MSYSQRITEAVRAACLSANPSTADDYAAMVAVLLQHAIISYLVGKNNETGCKLSETEMSALVLGTLDHIDRRIGSLQEARN